MISPARLVIPAPAKLNLGLAVTGRRPDGFHDLVTIFQAVSIVDTVTLSAVDPSTLPTGPGETRFSCSDPTIQGPDNLVVRAVDLVRTFSGRTDSLAVTLTKRIPAASGLGGASSDAAATLVGLNRLWNLRLPKEELHGMALGLGSDVPFFLLGGCAIAGGRGEILRPLPGAAVLWFVVIVPTLTAPIPRKTQSLFAALRDGDLRNGDDVLAQANRIESGADLDPRLLGNSFERPLYWLRPGLKTVRDALSSSGAPFVAISGAGPSHFTAVGSRAEAERIRSTFQRLYSGESTNVICTNDPVVFRRTSDDRGNENNLTPFLEDS